MALDEDKYILPDGPPVGGVQPTKSDTFGPKVLLRTDSTQILDFDGFSINADTTKFDHEEITARFVTNDVLGSESTVTVVIPAATAIVDAHRTTANITYVGCNSSSVILQQDSPFTAVQRRTIAVLGSIGHPDRAVITTAIAFPVTGVSFLAQFHDHVYAVSPISNGNKYTAFATDLRIQKTAGELTGVGLGHEANPNTPLTRAVAALTPLTSLLYVLRDGTNEAGTEVDPDFYDLAGVKTSVPANKYTIQIIVMFAGGFTNILWGQELYDSMDNAKTHLFAANYEIPEVVEESAILRTALIVKVGTTDLSDPALAHFKDLGRQGRI